MFDLINIFNIVSLCDVGIHYIFFVTFHSFQQQTKQNYFQFGCFCRFFNAVEDRTIKRELKHKPF